MAEIRQFAAVHNFAMLEGKSNGRARPSAVIKARMFQHLLLVNCRALTKTPVTAPI